MRRNRINRAFQQIEQTVLLPGERYVLYIGHNRSSWFPMFGQLLKVKRVNAGDQYGSEEFYKLVDLPGFDIVLSEVDLYFLNFGGDCTITDQLITFLVSYNGPAQVVFTLSSNPDKAVAFCKAGQCTYKAYSKSIDKDVVFTSSHVMHNLKDMAVNLSDMFDTFGMPLQRILHFKRQGEHFSD